MPLSRRSLNQQDERRRKLLDDLKRTAGGLDATLGDTVGAGVAFHHAGLTVGDDCPRAASSDSVASTCQTPPPLFSKPQDHD